MQGTTDDFIDINSIADWDYYYNGKNPNTSKDYHAKLFNISIIDVGRGKTIFNGDLDTNRINFLKKLSETTHEFGFFIVWEYKGFSPIFVYDGFVLGTNKYMKGLDDTKFFINDNRWGEHILSKRSD